MSRLFTTTDRYLLRELALPFASAIAAFVMMNIVNLLYIFASLIVQSHVAVSVVLKLLFYNLPAIMVITFPVAYMFSVLYVTGRMARDSEITALRACGVSFRRLATPLILGSVLVSWAGFWTNDRVVPWANHQVVQLIQTMMLRESKPVYKDNVFFRGKGNEYFYVREIDERTNELFDVIVFNRSGQIPVVLTAPTGTWLGQDWVLNNGVEHRYDTGENFVQAEVPFQTETVRVDQEAKTYYTQGNLSPQEQTSAELYRHIQDLKKAGMNTSSDEVDYHLKFSLPLAATVVALLAAPLGLKFGRFGIFIAVAITIALVAIYYVIMSIARSMGNAGLLEPFYAAWIENFIYAAVGVILLWRVDR